MSRLCRLSLFLWLAGFVMVMPLQADTVWTGANGTGGTASWSDLLNWNTSAVPGAADMALVNIATGAGNTPVISGGAAPGVASLGCGSLLARRQLRRQSGLFGDRRRRQPGRSEPNLGSVSILRALTPPSTRF